MDPHIAFRDFLAAVETGISAQLGGAAAKEGETLMNAARHLVLPGGKRARPLLVRIFGDTVGVSSDRLIDAAIAAELIHNASLLHDDVVDAGMFRRGKPTVNARWGNTVAVMSGDLMLAGALLRLARSNPVLCEAALKVIAEMTRAAIAEVEARGNLSLTLEQLRTIAEGKTGSLFGFCGIAAATLAGNPEAARRFDAFGRRIGIAFQMADDIRDVTGTDEGKPQYADLASRTPNLPIVLAVHSDPSVRRRVQESWSYPSMTPDRVRELGTAVLVSGVLDEAIARMNAEIDAAVEALGPFASTPMGGQLVTWARTLAQGIALQGAA